MLKLESYAKINLCLDIGKKLENGYHELKSVIQQINLSDELSFNELETDKVIVKCNIPEIEAENNICHKAAEMIKERFGIKKGIEIIIDKNIPIGAGLAGGSGNAAVTIKAMNEMFGLKLSEKEMIDIGKNIGSDVPFQIIGGTVLVEGYGEKLTKIDNIEGLNIVLVNPGINISTKWAYEIFDHANNNKINENRINNIIKAIKNKDLQNISDNLYNDFDKVVSEKYPEIKNIKKELVNLGAMNALMSGSGSSVFGLFKAEEEAKKACEKIKDKYHLVLALSSVSRINVTVAKNAGFCVGVKRALKEIDRIAGKGNIYVLGKLIHNPQVVESLEKKGVKSVDEITDLEKGSIVVITAHGIPDRKVDELRMKGFEVFDLTCPLVKTVHIITKNKERQGYRIIIFGDEEHIEVKGIKGNLKDPIILSEKEGISKIPKEGKYCIVSQTTQNVEKFNEIVEELKKHVSHLDVKDTICMPTKERQKESVELAKKSEIMIVIGGKMSANTRKLTQRCSEFTKTYHIETEKELNKSWFVGKDNIGVSAGASTPDYIINKVVETIKNGF